MNFTSAVGSAFRRMGDFTGRSSRSEYWYFFLLNSMILSSAAAVELAGAPQIVSVVASIWTLVALVPALSLFIRRLRDAGYSPWMSLFALAGPLGAVVFLVLLCQRSKDAAATSVNTESPSNDDHSERTDMAAQRHTSALLLGVCLLATTVVVLGSLTFAASQASMEEQEAQANASRIAAAGSSRAAASATAIARAQASSQAAALADARQLRDAEASRTAEASRSAAATAQAYASARDGLVAAGWYEGPHAVFYQWIPKIR